MCDLFCIIPFLEIFPYFFLLLKSYSNLIVNHALQSKLMYSMPDMQGPTSTLYSNRTRIFLSYSNPTRKFLKNDRVASSVYFSHFREIAARPASQYYSHMNTALVRSPMSFDHKKVNAFLGAKEIHNNFPETNTICIANSHSRKG